MPQRIKQLIYLTIGIFVVADIALHLQLPSGGSLFGKLTRERTAPAPEEGKDQSRPPQALERQRGPRIWVDATDQWASSPTIMPLFHRPVSSVNAGESPKPQWDRPSQSRPMEFGLQPATWLKDAKT